VGTARNNGSSNARLLVDAAKKLSEVENKLFAFHILWRMRMNGEITDEAAKIRLENKYSTEWQEAIDSFEETESLIHVSCSKRQ
jgi:hypothetical protein